MLRGQSSESSPASMKPTYNDMEEESEEELELELELESESSSEEEEESPRISSLADVILRLERMSLLHIRGIAKQLLMALSELKEVGALYSDINPDNVMLDLNATSPMLKSMGSGKPVPVTDLKHWKKVLQTLQYSPPEVILGLPLDEASDMWACGCTLAHLYLGSALFPFECEYDMIKNIFETLLPAEDEMLDVAMYTKLFFTEQNVADEPKWKLNSPEENSALGNRQSHASSHAGKIEDLAVLLHRQWPETGEEAEFEDRFEFIDLLKGMLHVNKEDRITPRNALRHPFITMNHMGAYRDSIYFHLCRVNMELPTVGDEVKKTVVLRHEEADPGFPKKLDCLLHGIRAKYLTKSILTSSPFGRLVRCTRLQDKGDLFLKPYGDNEWKTNIQIMSMLSLAQTGILSVEDKVIINDTTCLVFQSRRRKLTDMISTFGSMSLIRIRDLTLQWLTTLKGLSHLRRLHPKFTTDNFLLDDVNAKLPNLQYTTSTDLISYTDVQIGMKVQPLGFRAPEEILGLPFNEAINMWSCGCIVAQLYLGSNFLPFSSEYDMMDCIVQVLGQPEDRLLDAALHTERFFIKQTAADGSKWRLMSPEEYKLFTDKNSEKPQDFSSRIDCLDELFNLRWPVTWQEVEYDDRYVFIDLLRKMLHVDPEKRITPHEALQHSFITMDHMDSYRDDIYVDMARLHMDLAKFSDEGSKSLARPPNREPNVVLTASEVKPGLVLCSSSTSFLVMKIIGSGSYGNVFSCKNMTTNEMVAVKMCKFKSLAPREIAILELLRNQVDGTNIVKFIEWFEFMDLSCLVFELLDTDLHHLYTRVGTVSITRIRSVAKQLMVALAQLKDLGVIHTDIKPDNVGIALLEEPWLVVKLLDFGNAVQANIIKAGSNVQPLGYRAPEVMLGLPFNEAIDMWSCGCVLGQLYINEDIFGFDCEEDVMINIVKLLGQPEDRLLDAALFTEDFFIEETVADGPKWSLIKDELVNTSYVKSLDDLSCRWWSVTGEEVECEDRRVFIDLLRKMLHVDPEKRITPREALQHSFITMHHMDSYRDDIYIHIARRHMGLPKLTDEVKKSPAPPTDKEPVGLLDGDSVASSDHKDLMADRSDGEVPLASEKDSEFCSSTGYLPSVLASPYYVPPVSGECCSSREASPVTEDEDQEVIQRADPGVTLQADQGVTLQADPGVTLQADPCVTLQADPGVTLQADPRVFSRFPRLKKMKKKIKKKFNKVFRHIRGLFYSIGVEDFFPHTTNNQLIVLGQYSKQSN